jgi:hypothetical protein
VGRKALLPVRLRHRGYLEAIGALLELCLDLYDALLNLLPQRVIVAGHLSFYYLVRNMGLLSLWPQKLSWHHDHEWRSLSTLKMHMRGSLHHLWTMHGSNWSIGGIHGVFLRRVAKVGCGLGIKFHVCTNNKYTPCLNLILKGLMYWRHHELRLLKSVELRLLSDLDIGEHAWLSVLMRHYVLALNIYQIKEGHLHVGERGK